MSFHDFKPRVNDTEVVQNLGSPSKSLLIVSDTSTMQRSNYLPSSQRMASGAQGSTYFPTTPSHPSDLQINTCNTAALNGKQNQIFHENS